MTKIKICGLTSPEEALYINQNKVDYAGFVFFEKSKRNLTFNKAREIMSALDPKVKKVAVSVSPDINFVREVENLSFDILQIHKDLTKEVLEAAKVPIWYAVNISEAAEIEKTVEFIRTLPKEQAEKIRGLVVDAKNFGSGVTFDWQKSRELKTRYKELFEGRKFILAGGLKPENVKEGIEFFEPDAVDVSSGVEGQKGKDKEKIKAFCENARA